MHVKRIQLMALLVGVLLLAASPLAAKSIAGGTPPTVYAQVVIWDVSPAQATSFQNSLLQHAQDMAGIDGFLNDRVMRNIDSLTFHYATYTKGLDRQALESANAQRNAALRGWAIRDPEVHTLVLKSTYWGEDQGSYQPNGLEYDRDTDGQVAHLGIFVPFDQFRTEYDRTLDHVKIFTRDRLPVGYIGEDLLDGAEVTDPASLAPYSPQPFEPARVSVNYGEYETLEDAENSYIKRGEDRPNDPRILGWERLFYGALQVPTRFYIFRVIETVRGPGRNEITRLGLSK